MADFLSSEWLAELDTAAEQSRRRSAAGTSGSFVVEQRVTGVPSGDVCYHLVVDDSGSRVLVGAADQPDLLLVTDYATAVALQRGDLNAQAALATGRMRVRGRVESLVRHRDTISAVDDMFADVRARTTFPPGAPAGHR